MSHEPAPSAAPAPVGSSPEAQRPRPRAAYTRRAGGGRGPTTAAGRILMLGGIGTLVALPVLTGLGWLIAGAPGAWGALLGLLVPAGFLLVTAAVALATRRLDNLTAFGAAVMGSYLAKIVVLIAVLAVLRDQDFYHRGVFFVVLVAGTTAYLVMEALVTTRTPQLYVEPKR